MSKINLSSKVVVLTGASSGIGRAAALAFARTGASLVLAARGQAGLDEVAEECRLLDIPVKTVPCDVADMTAVQALHDAAVREFGHIDIWVNMVGVGAVGAFDAVPMAAHRQVIETNLLGHMHGAHAVLPHFKSRGKGTLINLISIAGFVPSPYASAYIASKFALRGFSEALRAELSAPEYSDIHVCEVYPTIVDTPGMSHGANYTGRSLRPPPPLVDARTVANTLVALAARPRPSAFVGSVAYPGRLAHALAPDLTGRITRKLIDTAFANADPVPQTDGNLYAPSQGNAIDGGWRLANKKDAQKPALGGTAVLAIGLALAGTAWVWRSRSKQASNWA